MTKKGAGFQPEDSMKHKIKRFDAEIGQQIEDWCSLELKPRQIAHRLLEKFPQLVNDNPHLSIEDLRKVLTRRIYAYRKDRRRPSYNRIEKNKGSYYHIRNNREAVILRLREIPAADPRERLRMLNKTARKLHNLFYENDTVPLKSYEILIKTMKKVNTAIEEEKEIIRKDLPFLIEVWGEKPEFDESHPPQSHPQC